MGFTSKLLDALDVPEILLGHTLVLLVSLSISSAVLLWGYFEKYTDHVREPPIAKPFIPLIGHILGMRKYGVRYLDMLRQKTASPAYTLKGLSNKTYVIVSPSLSHVALRSKSLSLEPLSVRIGASLLGLSKHATQTLGLASNGHWIGSTGIGERRLDFSKNLAPSGDLAGVTQSTGEVLSGIVNEFSPNWIEKDLYKWLRDTVTYATTVALYGPQNPLNIDRTLVEDVWTFDENQLRLTLGIFPSLTAREGLQARKRLSDAFEYYIRSNSQQYASNAVRSTIEIMKNHNLRIEDIARLEIFNISVATVNTAPTAIWMLLNILASDELLSELRKELESVMRTTPAADGKGRRICFDFSDINKACPLLNATYQEALRLGSIPTCNRAVLEDTILTDPETGEQVCLKKGCRVVIPTFLLHFRDSLWNGNAEEFDPYRFLNRGMVDMKEKKSQNNAYIPYGGGVHLCPGRHLAHAEILAVAGLMVAALDFELHDGGKITVPADAAASGSKKPVVPIIMRIRKRVGWEDVTWSFNS